MKCLFLSDFGTLENMETFGKSSYFFAYIYTKYEDNTFLGKKNFKSYPM